MVDKYWRRLREKSSVLLFATWTLALFAVLFDCLYTCSCFLTIFELVRSDSPLLAKHVGESAIAMLASWTLAAVLVGVSELIELKILLTQED